MNKKIERFLKRKPVVAILGEGWELSAQQYSRLSAFFKEYGHEKKCEEWFKTLANMVKLDLTNYVGRVRRLKKLPASPNLYAYYLRYGRNYEMFYQSSIKRKTSHFKNKVEYWTNLGYSIEHAKVKVSEIQAERSKLSPSSKPGANIYSKRCVGYWIERGFTEDEAKKKVSEFQSNPRSEEVIERWLATLAAKSPEEKARINFLKGHSVEAYIAKGATEEDAIALSNAYYAARSNASKSSQAFFMLLEQKFCSENTYYKSKNYERQFFGYCVDFYDADSQTVVEYYGDFWHRNPNKWSADKVVYKKSSAEIWSSDHQRIEKIKLHPDVKNVIIIWESEVNRNPTAVINNILQEIKNGS